MAKLVLGAFINIDQLTLALEDFEKAGVPKKDVSLVANVSEQTAPVWIAGDSVVAGGGVGSIAGLAFGALLLHHTPTGLATAVLAGFGWIVFFAIVCGVIGSIIGAILGVKIAAPHMPLTAVGSALLGVEDNKLSEGQIRNAFAKYGAEQIATVEHNKATAKLTAAWSGQ